MGQYHVICTIKSPAATPPIHGHIVRIGTEDTKGNSRSWTVRKFTMRWNRERRFLTNTSPDLKHVALVQKYRCPAHGFDTLQSAPDATTDNNVDNLPKCGSTSPLGHRTAIPSSRPLLEQSSPVAAALGSPTTSRGRSRSRCSA